MSIETYVSGLRPSRFFLFGLLLTLALSWLSAAPAQSCTGTPPPPRCGKSLVLAKAAPPVVLLPGGGTFNVPAVVFFSLLDFPPGSGICPGGPYAVSVNLTAACTPGPSGAGSVTGVAITPGFTNVAVPVTVAAGPPRICVISGMATVALADGMTLTATGDSVVCLAEPAPGDPSLPRLDMALVGAAGSEIARVHPGDQASHVYRITNNDPTESFSGELTVEMRNVSRFPGSSGPAPPGTGAFSISDPGAGDHPPIAFEEDLFQGCVVLPPDPTSAAIPQLTRTIQLAPGAAVDVPVHSRPWGMCADGSCGESTLVLDGMFTDLTPGKACSGFVVAADTGAASTYQWDDAGQAAQVTTSLGLGGLELTARATPDQMTRVDVTASSALLVNGMPLGAPPTLFASQISQTLGRAQEQFVPPSPFAADSSFDVFVRVDVAPSPGAMIDTELVQMDLVSSAPTGFEDRAPVAIGRIAIRPPGGFEVDSFFDITYQIHGIGIDELGARRDLLITGIDLVLRPDGSGFDIQLGGTVAAGAGTTLEALEVAHDLRGFISPQPQGLAIFADGFESGDVSVWSSSVGGSRR